MTPLLAPTPQLTPLCPWQCCCSCCTACLFQRHCPQPTAQAGAGRRRQELAPGNNLLEDTRKQFIFQWKLTGTRDMIPGQGVKGSAKRWGDNISGCKDQDWDPSPSQGHQETGSLSTARSLHSRAFSRDSDSSAGLWPQRSP